MSQLKPRWNYSTPGQWTRSDGWIVKRNGHRQAMLVVDPEGKPLDGHKHRAKTPNDAMEWVDRFYPLQRGGAI